MEWLDQWNRALDLLEEHLDQKPDLEAAARAAGCSSYHFQRMFSYLAGIPLSEYLRRRRMTLAAADLLAGASVMDTALRYGYESPTAFNRAFQSVHGVSPSAAGHGDAALRAFPRISFQITVKGEVAMEYRIVNREAFRIVGLKEPLEKELEKNFEAVPRLWERVASTGALEKLAARMDGEPKGVLGVSACCGGDDWAYYISVASTLPLPEDLPGVCEYTMPACTWAVFFGTGPMPNAITDLEKRVVTEWLPSSGYEYADAPDVEVYLTPDPANAVFEVWVPVRKK